MNYLKDFNAFTKPLAQKELAGWYQKTALITDPLFSDFARWSIKTKDFHSLGASVFAAPLPKSKAAQLVKGLVAFETIADFLDTLCDRGGLEKEKDFAALHQVMIETISLKKPSTQNPILSVKPYLKKLSAESQKPLQQLPQYRLIQPLLLKANQTYARMQTLTHLPPGERGKRCREWFEKEGRGINPPITWWEFIAAGGSTLSTFALILAGHNEGLTRPQARLIFDAYYPWMNGVNILLDSLIDQDEDDQTGDMNFISYYRSSDEALAGIAKFIATAGQRVGKLENSDFHHFVLKSMVKLYAKKALQSPRTESQAQKLLHLVHPWLK